MAIEIGKAAPDFTLPTDGGGEISLSALKGKNVIVYFYPKDDTPGCTKEACGFRDSMPDFSGVNAEIIGISKDSVAKHDKFKTKYELNYTLSSDESGDGVQSYDARVEKSMTGKKYMGIVRSTFLIDKEGVVRAHWKKVKVPGHVETVLKAAQEI